MTTAAAPEQRAAFGRAARASCRRTNHAGWDPPADRADPTTVLEQQAVSRVPELIPIRYGRMLASEFAFFRGGAAIMAADLATTPNSGMRVQLCGDAHLSNFGGFASPERELIFDINDFDETLPGPWEWDVKRLAASLAIAGRHRGFTGTQRRTVITAAVRQYREAMAQFATQRDLDVWYARLDTTGILTRWRDAVRQMNAASGRKQPKVRSKYSLDAFAKLTRLVDGEPRIVHDPPLLVPVEELADTDIFRAEPILVESLRQYRKSLPRARRHLLDQFHYVHFARKVVGVGSVGTRAWIMLLLGRDNNDPLFLQIKEAQNSVLAPYAGGSAYSNNGQRVVEGQQMLQASSDIFLGWVRASGVDATTRDFYVRQLWDGKTTLDVERMAAPTLELYAQMCGWTLARAHARSGDRIAIAAYLGSGAQFDEAIADFSEAYADQNAKDYAALAAAVRSGRIEARFGF